MNMGQNYPRGHNLSKFIMNRKLEEAPKFMCGRIQENK